ncbi:hypothetical protein I6A84_31115 [Frankia sp. CNm7]|uniref:Uncharacterized protein n=1 Tax=Frankia nepalensis TaxID=1836974 RepID=A0A937RHD5_9ACTN|nr:hypothetical protein [Frankia nepalensis]MBL7500251.1 hypothetical protein [Frankia nepalensis]MBL7513527.1 hypothetical protein [Frankia nepalensis]MBL7522416.1 hypothetical protein [Frankia nepalensis]MBL7628990.1 hypothetical protein [Frankia nepalensis]
MGEMAEYPGFAAVLGRLVESRGLDGQELSRRADVPEEEVRSVLGGVVPSSSLLHRLAPVLGLRVVDLFVMAQVTPPEELAPLDARAGQMVSGFVAFARHLSSEGRDQLRRYVRSLPQLDGRQLSPPRRHERFPPGPGGVMMRLFANRNLDQFGAAEVLAWLTPVYLSGSTYGRIGHGYKELTPGLLAGFATVLDVEFDDLAAVAGLESGSVRRTPDPVAADIARMIWDLRRLTIGQVEQARREATRLRSLL